MRRFNVHLVIDLDFEDGAEASDQTVQNYQKHLKGIVQSAAQGVSLRQSRAPGSRVSRSQKSRMSSSNPREPCGGRCHAGSGLAISLVAR
jgi:hypothetical protein